MSKFRPNSFNFNGHFRQDLTLENIIFTVLSSSKLLRYDSNISCPFRLHGLLPFSACYGCRANKKTPENCDWRFNYFCFF